MVDQLLSPSGAATAARDADAERRVGIIGAGPAGLTAAYWLGRQGVPSVVWEQDDVVGGISRTVERDGYRFDIGGHRFFTKVPEVRALWWEILGSDDFLLRPRTSRIHYHGAMFDYPLRAFNALSGLGLVEAARCVLSYMWARVRPPREQTSFEGWTTARFGARLYRIFFKTYTEKVWGMPATEIQADWAAQRIKNLSLAKAILNAISPRLTGEHVTSLIEQFHYPKLGPGMMWERARCIAQGHGAVVHMRHAVRRLRREGDRVTHVTVESNDHVTEQPVSHVISSMPFNELVLAMDPPAPEHVQQAARALRHRDFLTVALVVPEDAAFPDTWIYIHDPDVHVGRIQNFRAWSPHMVQPGRTCLGMEYFVSAGDALWEMRDEDLVALATDELYRLGIVRRGVVERGFVVRMPKAYPVYDGTYSDNVAILRAWLEEHASNVIPVGRNGMHRYNNRDHSMLTAMLAAENVMGARHDIWAVNVEAEYHEEARGERWTAAQRAVASSSA